MTDFSRQESPFNPRHGRAVEPKPGSGSSEEAKPAAAEAPKKKERAYSLGKALGGLISRAKEGFAATGRHAKEVAMPAWDRVLAAKKWVLEKRSRAEVSIDVSKKRTDDGLVAENHGSESSEELDVVDGFPDHYINRDTEEIVQEVRMLRADVMGRLNALEAYLQDEIKQAGDADETDLLEENRSLHQELREVRTKKKIINIMAANVTNAHKREKSFREMGEEMKALEEKQKIVAMLEKLIDLDNELKGADGGSKETGFLRATAQEIFAQFGRLNVRELFKRLGTDPELRDAAIAMGTQTALKLLLGTTGVGSGVVLGVVKGVQQEVSMRRITDTDKLAERVREKYGNMTDRFSEHQTQTETAELAESKKRFRWARALGKMGVNLLTVLEKAAAKVIIRPDHTRNRINRFVSSELKGKEGAEAPTVSQWLNELQNSEVIDKNYLDKLNKLNTLYADLVKLEVLGFPQDPNMREQWFEAGYKEKRAAEVELYKAMLSQIRDFIQQNFSGQELPDVVQRINPDQQRQRNRLNNTIQSLVKMSNPEHKRELALDLGRKMYVAEMIGMIGRGGVLDLLVGRPEVDFDTNSVAEAQSIDQPAAPSIDAPDTSAELSPEATPEPASPEATPEPVSPEATPVPESESANESDGIPDDGLSNADDLDPALEVPQTEELDGAFIPAGFEPDGGWEQYPGVRNPDGTLNFSAPGVYKVIEDLGINSGNGISGFARSSLEQLSQNDPLNSVYLREPVINLSTKVMQGLGRSLTETELQALVDAFSDKEGIADMFTNAAQKIATGANPEGAREDLEVLRVFINTLKTTA